MKIGDKVKITRNSGEKIIGILKKENPLNIRTSPTDVLVIPNRAIKTIEVIQNE